MAAALSIILIEDHDALRELVMAGLTAAGHRVRGADCAEAVAEMLAVEHCDLLLCDLNLPGEDGISLCRRLRQVQPKLGVFMMTGRSRLEDRLCGYDSGADLYLSKPVPLPELLAAVAAFSRRLQAEAPASGLCLELGKLVLSGQAASTVLTPSEAGILAALIRAPGRRLEYWQLLECLGMADDMDKSRIEPHVSRLRSKLAQVGAPAPAIKSLRNLGYQLLIELRLI